MGKGAPCTGFGGARLGLALGAHAWLHAAGWPGCYGALASSSIHCSGWKRNGVHGLMGDGETEVEERAVPVQPPP